MTIKWETIYEGPSDFIRVTSEAVMIHDEVYELKTGLVREIPVGYNIKLEKKVFNGNG